MSKSEKKSNSLPTWQNVLIWVFFPIGLFRLLYFHLSKRFRMDISTKTSLLNGVLFFVMITSYAIVVLVNVGSALDNGNTDDLLLRLVIISVIILPVFLVIFVAYCTLTGKRMLSPVRKMINKMDEITAESLSARLDTMDTQDELMDLTDRINSMLDDIDETFQRQRNFVSDASHELRTPISVVQGYSDLLSRWGKDDAAVLDESITAIRSEATNMRTIVEQLLYLAKIGSFKPKAVDFDLAEAVRDIVDGYETAGVERRFAFYAPDIIPIHADRSLVVELVRIITDNAIKYTKKGGSVQLKAFADEKEATVTVIDNGIGISEADLPHIFDRFYRCDKARERKSGGVGLGLSIAKSIVTTMGGNIKVTSTLGSGSRFVINLPIRKESA